MNNTEKRMNEYGIEVDENGKCAECHGEGLRNHVALPEPHCDECCGDCRCFDPEG